MLQKYEAEVRNHIKVEQQLKLHIEVLKEKIDDLEKDKKEFDNKIGKQRQVIETKMKQDFAKVLEGKNQEIEKLTKELKKQKEFVTQSFERSRIANNTANSNQGTATHVKVVRVNNFTGSQDGKKNRDNAQSHSPSGLGASNSGSKESVVTQGKLKKALKVIGSSAKSPYLNSAFNKRDLNQSAQ